MSCDVPEALVVDGLVRIELFLADVDRNHTNTVRYRGVPDAAPSASDVDKRHAGRGARCQLGDPALEVCPEGFVGAPTESTFGPAGGFGVELEKLGDCGHVSDRACEHDFGPYSGNPPPILSQVYDQYAQSGQIGAQ